MSQEDIVEQLESLKAEIRANPEVVESAGPRLREIISLARTEIGSLVGGPGGPAGYCHSHCGSHCISHPQGRFGMMSRYVR